MYCIMLADVYFFLHKYTSADYFIRVKIKVYEPMFEIPALKKVLEREWRDLTRRYPGAILGRLS